MTGLGLTLLTGLSITLNSVTYAQTTSSNSTSNSEKKYTTGIVPFVEVIYRAQREKGPHRNIKYKFQSAKRANYRVSLVELSQIEDGQFRHKELPPNDPAFKFINIGLEKPELVFEKPGEVEFTLQYRFTREERKDNRSFGLHIGETEPSSAIGGFQFGLKSGVSQKVAFNARIIVQRDVPPRKSRVVVGDPVVVSRFGVLYLELPVINKTNSDLRFVAEYSFKKNIWESTKSQKTVRAVLANTKLSVIWELGTNLIFTPKTVGEIRISIVDEIEGLKFEKKAKIDTKSFESFKTVPEFVLKSSSIVLDKSQINEKYLLFIFDIENPTTENHSVELVQEGAKVFELDGGFACAVGTLLKHSTRKCAIYLLNPTFSKDFHNLPFVARIKNQKGEIVAEKKFSDLSVKIAK